jgi:hypothetical protein
MDIKRLTLYWIFLIRMYSWRDIQGIDREEDEYSVFKKGIQIRFYQTEVRTGTGAK